MHWLAVICDDCDAWPVAGTASGHSLLHDVFYVTYEYGTNMISVNKMHVLFCTFLSFYTFSNPLLSDSSWPVPNVYPDGI